MSEEFLFNVLNGKTDLQKVIQWLQNEYIQDESFITPCSRIDFVLHLISFLRNQTSSILQIPTAPNRNPASPAIVESPVVTNETIKDGGITNGFISIVKPQRILSSCNKSNETTVNGLNTDYEFTKQSTNKDNKYLVPRNFENIIHVTPEKVLTITENESTDSILSNISPIREEDSGFQKFEARFSTPNNSLTSNKSFENPSPLMNKSTRNSFTQNESREKKSYSNSMKYHGQKTNKLQHEYRSLHNQSPDIKFNHSNNHQSLEKPTSNKTNICIADFMVSKTEKNVSKKKKHKFVNLSLNEVNFESNNVFQRSDCNEFNIQDENSFPEIENSSSRNQPRRRINPTRLNLSDQSHNYNTKSNIKFGIKCDKAEQNEAFKNQIFQPNEQDKNFNAERNILKLEKEKLLQKFGTLNSSSCKIKSSPSNKIFTSVAVKPLAGTNCISTLTLSPDPKCVTNSKALDILSAIYATVLDLNLIINYTSEIQFLISLLVSQVTVSSFENNVGCGTDENCDNVVKKEESDSQNNSETNHSDSSSSNSEKVLDLTALLKNIHNCVYFSIKTLCYQVSFLDSLMDNTSLKILLQNQRLKLFCPKLSEQLLTICDQRQTWNENQQLQSVSSGKNVCFNTETDSEENFQSQQGFYTFKKQRDLFYEILRIWEDQHNSANWNFNMKLGGMIRSLISMSLSPSNVAHLAHLFREQLITTCTGRRIIDEDSLPEVAGASADKLNKLAQRLVAEPTRNMQNKKSKPDFPECQEFFRDFLIVADNVSFQQHVSDCLIEEIYRLNNTHFMSIEKDEIISKKIKFHYLSCLINLQVLGKFLGFVISLPYRIPTFQTPTTGQRHVPRDIAPPSQFIVPKEKVLHSSISVRQQMQPQLNLLGLLKHAKENHRLILTVPWILQLLAMLDYTTLRLPYYKTIICILFQIYQESSTTIATQSLVCSSKFQSGSLGNSCNAKLTQQSQILLKISIGWFLDMQHFPQEFFYSWVKNYDSEIMNKYLSTSKQSVETVTNGDLYGEYTVGKKITKEEEQTVVSIKSNSYSDTVFEEQYGEDIKLDLLSFVDCHVLLNVCPHLKDLKNILICNREAFSGSDNKSYRHITPVTSSLTEDNIKRNKSRQLQIQLEDWFMRSQSQSTSRILRSIGERVGSALLRLIKTQIPHLKLLSFEGVLNILQNNKGNISETEIKNFNTQLLNAFKIRCIYAAKCCGRERTKSALQGMLPPATPQSVFNLLLELSLRRAMDSCTEWLNNNTSIDILTTDLKIDNVRNTKGISQKQIQEYLNVDKMNHKLIPDDSMNIEKHPAVDFDVNNFYSGALCIVKIKELCVLLISGIALQKNVEEIEQLFHECLNLAEMCTKCSYIQTTTLRVIGQLTLDLTILIISLFSLLLTNDVLKKLKNIWTNSLLIQSRVLDKIDLPSTKSDTKNNIDEEEIDMFKKYLCNNEEAESNLDGLNESLALLEEDNLCNLSKSLQITQNSILNDSETSKVADGDDKTDLSRKNNEFFSTLLCPRNIMYFGQLGGGHQGVWQKLAMFLAFSLKNQFISEESITEQCLAVYRQEWPQNTLEGLSSCIKELSEIHPLSSEQLRLFLDFVVEFCQNIAGDLDFEC